MIVQSQNQEQSKKAIKSAIYSGIVRHRRYSPRSNQFSYKLYMLALDIDEVANNEVNQGLIGKSWYKPIRIEQKDYLKGEPGTLKQRIKDKVASLGGTKPLERITMLVQVRCLGLYFSPANFYFCYNKHNNCEYMLVEVSNTPWNKRHYYLVDMLQISPTDKEFHVSPFMDLAMQYHWKVKAPQSEVNSKMLVHIENVKQDSGKVFDATLALANQQLTSLSSTKLFLTYPMMTLKVILGIYYQAIRLFAKRIPFVSYQTKKL
ncbi:DUF1365 domain-containing protein [Thalassotalea sp. M1531]|uniref:DUF1365 domain-containing protein n=1 Tax=Thalassotalea algicola TaxID=2716224 RepID=A0A7Y0Q808_9GAMM|nr:DUF1365 domain-containing protein [Thalassotalea algicola]NMP31595.1 DUF1365 domain-containing protein [Thalassotalea algicola]